MDAPIEFTTNTKKITVVVIQKGPKVIKSLVSA